MIKVAMKVLPVAIKTLSSEMAGETIVPAVASLPSIQVVAKVLFVVIELLAIKTVGETTSKAGGYGKAATSMLALPEVAYPERVLPMVAAVSLKTPCLMPVGCLTHYLGSQLIALPKASRYTSIYHYCESSPFGLANGFILLTGG